MRQAYAEEFDDKERGTRRWAGVHEYRIVGVYLDILKDALYCDPPSSVARKAA